MRTRVGEPPCVVETTASATCPYCGENNEVPLDLSPVESVFVTDCDNCCRPFSVRARFDAGEIVSLETSPS